MLNFYWQAILNEIFPLAIARSAGQDRRNQLVFEARLLQNRAGS